MPDIERVSADSNHGRHSPVRNRPETTAKARPVGAMEIVSADFFRVLPAVKEAERREDIYQFIESAFFVLENLDPSSFMNDFHFYGFHASTSGTCISLSSMTVSASASIAICARSRKYWGAIPGCMTSRAKTSSPSGVMK